MRGYLKRRRQRQAIAQHMKAHGTFQFDGRPIMIPADLDLGTQSIIADGSYEAAECSLIDRFLIAELPVIELGGCLGLVSGFVASRLAEGTQQIIVEANPTLQRACLHNGTLAGSRTDTTIVAKAVAYSGAQVSFDVKDNVHVSKLSTDNASDAAVVEAITLHDLVQMIDAQFGYTLICDIEGAEIDILEKDPDALKACQLVIMELHPDVYEIAGYTVDGVIDMVRGIGLDQVAIEGNVYAFKRPAALIS